MCPRRLPIFKFNITSCFSFAGHKINSSLDLEIIGGEIFLKAAVYRGSHNIRVEEVPEPRVSGRKVLIEFKEGSVCGTDLHFYRGEWKWMKRGRIIGHELAELE
jgi:hypothetical protein